MGTVADELEWQRNLRWLHGLARRLATSVDDADDLVQETWLQTSSAPENGARAWLGGVLRNRWRMRLRSESRRRNREASEEVPLGPADPELQLARTRVVEVLCEALGELPQPDRQMLILRHCEELDATEIGHRLDLPPATVRTRLRRSRRRLRAVLDERWGEDGPPWHLAIGVGPTLASKPGLWLGGSMSLFKISLGALALATVAATSWWVVSPTGEAVASTTESSAGEEGRPAADSASAPPEVQPDAGAQRREKLARVREARKARIAAARMAPNPADEGDIDRARESVRAYFRNEALGDEMRATFAQLGEQIAAAFLECLDTFPAKSGRIRLQAQLIGEPDVGVVVETVDIEEDTTGEPQLRECVEQSVYAFDFRPPDEALYDVYDFVLDLDAREISAGGTLPVEDLPRMVETYPELLAELPKILAESPEVAAELREHFESDPELVQQYPAFARILMQSR